MNDFEFFLLDVQVFARSLEKHSGVKEAIAVITENNIQIGKMTEFQALQVLLESDYLPKDAAPQIGTAYMTMKQAIKKAFSEDK